MPARKVSDEQIIEAQRRFPKSQRKAAKWLGIGQSSFSERLNRIAGKQEPPLENADIGKVKADIGKGKGWIEYDSFEMPKEQELFDMMNLDPECWQVTRVVPGSWQGFYKKERVHEIPSTAKAYKIADDHVVVTLYRLRIYIERVVPEPIEDIVQRLAERSDPLPKPARGIRRATTKKKTGQLGVFGLYDAHIGDLCWIEETDENNDTRIAKTRCMNAIDDLIGELSLYPIEKLIVPIGNDFAHIDNIRGETTAGRQLDFDSRYGRIVETCHEVLVHLVDRCLELCDDVLLPLVGGNHDQVTSLHLAHWIKQRYRNDPRVVVDTSPKPRKYYVWGSTLIGFAHGDCLNIKDVYRHMAEEAREHWAIATCREFHTGDKHHRKQVDQGTVDTYGKVTFRQNSSLAPRNAWTFKMGFDSIRCADAFRYGLDGYKGNHACYARRD